jgi:hypothetical protein
VVFAPPGGVDPAGMESVKAWMHLFEPRHCRFPFLAQALGTLAGAAVAAAVAAIAPAHGSIPHHERVEIQGASFARRAWDAAGVLEAPATNG